MKIGSLFDGSGGFPLAATVWGIKPVWASEVEPFPIAVTRSRFPDMKHLGSVTDVKGNEVEPVDVITFGSPCQDLSVAGKRAGLKHTENGDEETTRSGLFMEAIRIIKEMREATNGAYPRFAVWENVPGAFSSNKGEDFRIVLEEFVKIVEPTAVMPTVPKGGWPYADSYCGDGWSISYRVFDAQYWGVPQRRRRIYLVADFRGQCAGKVSFEREGLRGYFTESGSPWKSIAGDAENSIGTADRGLITAATQQYLFENHSQDSRYRGPLDLCPMLPAQLGTGGNNQPFVVEKAPVYVDTTHADDVVRVDNKVASLQARDFKGGKLVCQPICCIDGDKIGKADRAGGSGLGIRDGDKMYTLTAKDAGTHAVAYTKPIVLDRAFFNQGQNALYEPQFYEDGTVPTLVAKGPSAVAYWDGTQTCGTLTANNAGGSQRMPDKENFNCVIEEHRHPDVRYIVRRLTPTECARLQGFPDEWAHPDIKTELTDEEYEFWLNVRNTHAEINGKATKDYTKDQMLAWHNKLHTDSSEYKMWGNGIALPCALYVMQGIAEVLNESRN